MTVANVSQASVSGLPPALTTAQLAIQLPEVQDMLRRLSGYRLGIFMPHMHDEESGEFQTLPDGVIQVESGLEVSFHPRQDINHQTDRFLAVGWIWHAGASALAAACEMVSEGGSGATERVIKHEMVKRS